MREINEIIIHCSATPPDMDIGVEEIREWHRQRGWSDVGYHEVIRRNGLREHGRPLNEIGAHAYGHNVNSIGICLVGGTNADDKTKGEANFTFEQLVTLHEVVSTYKGMFPNARVLGHRDIPGVTKACPCFDVAGFFRSLA